MKNKIKIGISILVLLGLGLASFYFWNTQREVNIQDINNCNSDSDCVIVASGFCGGASAINRDNLEVWNNHLEAERARNQGVLCEITLPLDYFKAKCINNKCSAIQTQETIKPSSPLQATLSLSDKPLLNTPVTLTLSFKSILDAPNTSAKIELPEGFELVNGNLEWQGDLKENENQKIEVVVKSTKGGYYQLNSSVISKQQDSTLGDNDIIYVEVSQNDAIIGSRPENNWVEPAQGQTVPLAENNEQIQSELIISQNPELNKEFTITYRLTPSINIPDPQRTQMSLIFPPKAFEIVSIQFPEGGETYRYKSQLSWKGSINKGQTVEIKATFKVINIGWGLVYGNLNVQPSGEITSLIQDVKTADLYVDKYTRNIIIPENNFTEIQGCIMGVIVDYISNKSVQNKEDAAVVFDEFIRYSKENNKDIFGYGNNWRFENATVHGLYSGVKYWKVTASWFSEEYQKWMLKTVFDVSENGEVVRFLGCI